MIARRWWLGGIAGLALLCWGAGAWAWDAAETHAGLTEEAVSASHLHALLTHKLGRGLGLWETLRLPATLAQVDEGRRLQGRLNALDASGGYRPDQDGGQPVLAWIVAGTVLEKTPPERARHHFLDPRTGKGLEDSPGLSGTLHAVSLSFDEDSSARDLATGQAFDLTGKPSPEWIRSKYNDLGLGVLLDQYERSATMKTKTERETALVRAMLALGGILCVVEDAGHPAYARNDFRGEFLGARTGSALDALVRDRMGRVALPKSTGAVERPTLDSYLIAQDGKGLAQIAGEQFFSAGTLPADTLFPGRSLERITSDANATLRLPSPTVEGLRLPAPGKVEYLRKDGRRLVAYRRVGDDLHFSLTPKVLMDSARTLLPLVLSYTTGVVNHLFRGELAIAVKAGKATVRLQGLSGIKGPGRSTLLFEDDRGERSAQPGFALDASLSAVVPIPAGTRKIAVAWRGEDAAGEVVVTSEAALP